MYRGSCCAHARSSLQENERLSEDVRVVEAELLRLVCLEKEVEQMASAVEYAQGLATAVQRADIPRVGE